MFERFGVAFWNDLSCQELRRLGQRADELGFDSIWLAESYHYWSVPPLAAAIGCDTRRIRIALGVLPTHTRHPGLVAMEAATLDELTGGRLILGLAAAIGAAGERASPDGPGPTLTPPTPWDAITVTAAEPRREGEPWPGYDRPGPSGVSPQPSRP